MGQPILTLTDVVAGYGQIMILNGASFAVRPRAITTIIGPNGAGKSTALKAAFGLLPIRAGRIAFDGADVTGLDPRALLARGIVYVPQGRNLFPGLSVRHNLVLGVVAVPGVTDVEDRVRAALARFPMLAAKAGAQASTLSGGQQKILEIARGLMLAPKLLLIDEPSIGLSPIMVRDVFAILTGLRDQGVSILLIEQNARAALAISDDGIVLEQGRTALADRAPTLLADPRVGRLFLGGGLNDA
jgi:branched-chain amino acid transport system ATP-binding protein